MNQDIIQGALVGAIKLRDVALLRKALELGAWPYGSIKEVIRDGWEVGFLALMGGSTVEGWLPFQDDLFDFFGRCGHDSKNCFDVFFSFSQIDKMAELLTETLLDHRMTTSLALIDQLKYKGFDFDTMVTTDEERYLLNRLLKIE